MQKCKVIFSIIEENSGLLSSIGFNIIFIFLFILISWFVFVYKKDFLSKIIIIVFALFSILFVTYFITDEYNKYAKLKKLYQEKKYKEIVGKIQNFENKKIKPGYNIITFKVGNIKFKFSNVYNSGGYNNTKDISSYVDTNKSIKIRYIEEYLQDTENIILYLEVCP